MRLYGTYILPHPFCVRKVTVYVATTQRLASSVAFQPDFTAATSEETFPPQTPVSEVSQLVQVVPHFTTGTL